MPSHTPCPPCYPLHLAVLFLLLFGPRRKKLKSLYKNLFFPLGHKVASDLLPCFYCSFYGESVRIVCEKRGSDDWLCCDKLSVISDLLTYLLTVRMVIHTFGQNYGTFVTCEVCMHNFSSLLWFLRNVCIAVCKKRLGFERGQETERRAFSCDSWAVTQVLCIEISDQNTFLYR